MKTADYESLTETDFYIYAYFDEHDVPIYVKAGRNGQSHAHIQGSREGFRDNNAPAFYWRLREMYRDGFRPTIRLLLEGLTQEEAFEVWEDFFIHAVGTVHLGTGPLLNEPTVGDGDALALRPVTCKPAWRTHARRSPARSTARQHLQVQYEAEWLAV